MTRKPPQKYLPLAPSKTSRPFSFYLLPFILLLALGLRLLLWNTPLHQPANDEVEYIAVARDLLAGRGWQFYEHYHWLRAPLYPLFLAGSLWLAGAEPPLLEAADTLHRAALPNIVLSVAAVYLGYRLALELAGRRAALLAALFGALLWTCATFASLYMSETLFTFLFTGALLCLVRAGPNRLPIIALGGVLFGLATLTRSITLLFLPIAAAWLLLRPDQALGKSRPISRSALARSASFVLCAILTIAPWTIRNYQAYGRVIPVETGLSYNLWVFSEPHERQSAIYTALDNIANPAERSDYATAKGLARLREDPAIVLRKLPVVWVYLWQVKPIEDRFLMENYYGDIGLPLFLSALIFDDALYFVIALAGIAGLVVYRRGRPAADAIAAKGERPQRGSAIKRSVWASLRDWAGTPEALLAAWLLYAIGTMLLTHSEGRYRHFLFPALIPYAAWALVRFADCRLQIADWIRHRRSAAHPRQSAITLSQIALVALAWVLIGGTFLYYYPWRWAAENLARGWFAARAEIAWAQDHRAQAFEYDQRALAEQETIDGWLRLGDHARATGDTARALAAYNAARELSRNYIPEVAKLGDLLRASGKDEEARKIFDTEDADLQQLADRSWRYLQPEPRTTLAIGDGLDFGYIMGMYVAEPVQGAQARWTNGRAQIRLGGAPAPMSKRVLVQLRLAAPHPNSSATSAQVCLADQCWMLNLGPTWRTYTVAFEASASTPLEIALRSTTFDAPDGRKLGVLVDQAELVAE